MRATGCLCALLGALSVLPVAAAQADIKPLPKPAVVTPTPGPGNRGSLIAPVSKPVVPTTVRPARPHVATTPPATPAATSREPAAPALSLGGREQPALAGSGGGRAAPVLPPVAVLAPTRLGVVGANEPRRVLGDAWPRWMLALLALLALAEVGILAQLVRSSPARTGRA